jgi:hypothetical protein
MASVERNRKEEGERGEEGGNRTCALLRCDASDLVFRRIAVALFPKAVDGGTGGLVCEAAAEQVVAEPSLEGGERERRERARSAVSGSVSGARFVEVG